MVLRAVLGALAAGTLLLGCADSRELEYRITQAETQRDQAQAALRDQQARYAALDDQFRDQTRLATTADAKSTALEERTRQLEERNAELAAIIERLNHEPLAAPEVPASPLPAEVDAALLSFAERNQGRVWYERGRGAISLANDRLFQSGSDEVLAQGADLLRDLAGIAALLGDDLHEIIIVGHTDAAPIRAGSSVAERHPTNWHLSVHRAIAVEQLLADSGVPEERMGVMGYGPYRPIGPEAARNRRVEVFFVPKGEVAPRAPVEPRS